MERIDLIKQLIVLTQEQREALMQEDTDLFITILDKREAILQQIKMLDDMHEHTKSQEEEALITQLIILDNENNIEFKKQFDNVKEKLKGIRMMKQKENNYSNPYNMSREEGVLFDKKNR